MKLAASVIRNARTSDHFDDVGAKLYSWEEMAAGSIPSSVPVGEDDAGLWLADFSRGHVMVSGQTDSGKTKSVLLNTVFLNAMSRQKPGMVVIDAKATSYNATSAILRQNGYVVRHIDLRSDVSEDRYNPLHEFWLALSAGNMSIAEDQITDVCDALAQLVRDNDDAFWHNAASDLIRACAYARFEKEPRRETTLGDVSDMIRRGKGFLTQTAGSLGDSHAGRLLSAAVGSHIPNDTFGCIMGVAQTMLRFFASSTGRHVAGTSSFDIEEDFFGPNPTAIYVTAADEGSSNCKMFASLFFDKVYYTYTRHFESQGLEGKPTRGVRVIFDEFASYPPCAVPKVLATARSRNFFVMCAFQSTSQMMASGYRQSEAEVMLSQFANSFFFRSADERVASVAALKTGGAIHPDQLVGLRRGEAFVVFGGKPAIRSRLPRFEDLAMRDWLGVGRASGLDESGENGSSEAAENVSAAAPVTYGRGGAAAELVWAASFRSRLEIAPDMTGLLQLFAELSNREEAIGGSAVASCGEAFMARLAEMQESSRGASQRLVEAICSGEAPINPALARPVYREVLIAQFRQGAGSSMKLVSDDIRRLCCAMVDEIDTCAEAALGDGDPRHFARVLGLGNALSDFIASIEADNSPGMPRFRSALMKRLRAKGFATCKCIVGYYAELLKEKEDGTDLFGKVLGAVEDETHAALKCQCIRAFGKPVGYDVCDKMKALILNAHMGVKRATAR